MKPFELDSSAAFRFCSEMTTAAPLRLERITIRVCEDLGWAIYVSCPKCRVLKLVRGEQAASRPSGRLPLPLLLERRLMKCEKCDGWPDQVAVSYSNVGRTEDLAVWQLHQSGDRYYARLKGER